MLTTASWTVFLDDGPIDGLCGYEITLYRGEEIINRFFLKIEKELPHISATASFFPQKGFL